jgi:prepilin-type N-terminal cleavage/methylation domain-containing protein
MNSVAKKKLKQEIQSGFSLVELLVVLVIVASLVALSIPAINAMQKSFGSTGAEGMISTALSTARTLAIKNGHYAGVRFQKEYNKKGPLEANQYMIFIIYNSDSQITNWVCGFVAVEGYKPMKLPVNISVIDKMVRNDYDPTANWCNQINERPLIEADLDDSDVANLDPIGNNRNITDISTFSIVFSPAGKLVSHEVRCRGNLSISDDVFNTRNNVTAKPPIGMFFEDNHDDFGIGVEMSRREFVLYDREKFEKMTNKTQRMNYLNGLKPMYINPYTGEIIK